MQLATITIQEKLNIHLQVCNTDFKRSVVNMGDELNNKAPNLLEKWRRKTFLFRKTTYIPFIGRIQVMLNVVDI
jgi:hypothetical protein